MKVNFSEGCTVKETEGTDKEVLVFLVLVLLATGWVGWVLILKVFFF